MAAIAGPDDYFLPKRVILSLIVFVPEGLIDSSPTPQSLRRDRNGWSGKMEGFGCAVVCEGDLAVYCQGSVRKGVPSR